MSWTDERVETLKRLWGQGSSASQIAKILGSVTRNAVIGKAHRLGLSQGRPAQPRVERPRAERTERVHVPRPEPAPKPLPVEDLSDAPKVPLMLLRERMCKWPLGNPEDGDLRFCGRESAAGLPYCREHAMRAYQPAPKKDRNRASG